MNKKKSLYLRFAIHLLALMILFVLPEVMMSVETRSSSPMQWHFYGKALIFVGVFYIEYYAVLRGRPDGRLLTWRFTVENIVVMGVVLTTLWLLRPPIPPHANNHGYMIVWVRDLGMVVLTMALAVAMKLSERIHQLDARRREMEDTHRSEELKQLKSQLNPHFLFNALNTIYALTEIDSTKARAAVHTLSRMLRYALYEADKPTVALGREVEFIADYVKLMKMRLAGSVPVTTRIECPESMADMPIAPMLFISPVENAFKHGVTGSPDDEIMISLIVTGNGTVECTVINYLKESDTTTHCNGRQSGVGIVNLRRRLELIYGTKATLTTKAADNKFVTSLKISEAYSYGTARE